MDFSALDKRNCFEKNMNIYLKQCSLYIDGLVQDYSISIANALEILQSCTKPSIYYKYIVVNAVPAGAGCWCHSDEEVLYISTGSLWRVNVSNLNASQWITHLF